MSTADNFELGQLGYGTAPLGNLFKAISDEQAAATLDAAWDAGIRYFDTAPHYGMGLSEKRLGRALADKPRDEFVVSTKVGRIIVPNPGGVGTDMENSFDVPATSKRVIDYSADGIRRSAEGSLERTGLDRLDILFLHDPDENPAELGGLTTALKHGVPALLALREEGLVRAVGIGTKSLDAVTGALDLGDLDLVMLSGRYTLLEQPAAETVLPLCLERGVGVIDVSVFNSGLLASARPNPDAHYDYGPVPPAIFERAVRLADVCAAHGVELPAAALQYPLRHPAIRSVLFGTGRVEQLRQNVERANIVIPEQLWVELAAEGLIPA